MRLIMSLTAIVNWKANQIYNENAKKLIKATKYNPDNNPKMVEDKWSVADKT